MLPMKFLVIIVCVMVILTLGLIVAYCLIKKRLNNAQRVKSEVSAAVREAELA